MYFINRYNDSIIMGSVKGFAAFCSILILIAMSQPDIGVTTFRLAVTQSLHSLQPEAHHDSPAGPVFPHQRSTPVVAREEFVTAPAPHGRSNRLFRWPS